MPYTVDSDILQQVTMYYVYLLQGAIVATSNPIHLDG